ncbi:MAG: HTH domain-containing protein [Rhodospirillales bacterium]|nr:HTH domain-containing protein [Rhodospirillales bacterium]
MMDEGKYTEAQRLEVIRLLDRLYQGERHLGARDIIDVLILRTVAMGKMEGRPMDVSALSYYLGLSRQTVGRRIKGLEEQGALVVETQGRRHVLLNSDQNRKRSIGNLDRNIDDIRAFVRELDKED